MKGKYFIFIVFIALSSCKDDFLTPKPLSFFSPENSLTDKAGFDALNVSADKQLKHEWYGNPCPLVYEYAFTDLNIMGIPDQGMIRDMPRQVTPYADAFPYWQLAWDGIKYANVGITRAMESKTLTEAERDEILAKGYFHRAYWYYRLVHQYGDVPLILEEITTPRLNFVSSSRKRILQKMKQDMEFAVQHLPLQRIPGTINRAAGEMLLTKIYLSVGEFDNAVQSSTRCIDNYGLHLMTNRFGAIKNNPEKDVVGDLFHVDNISIAENTEAILVVQERFGLEGDSKPKGSARMRVWAPYWCGPDVLAPNGKRGCIDGRNVPLMDSLGRGIAWVRPTNYYQYQLWANSGNDYRHNNQNWYNISRLWYNNAKVGDNWYGKPVQRAYVLDTVRCYFSFPYYKVFVIKDDPNVGNNPQGGFTDQYIYRLAEAYLLRAEANVWLNRADLAAADIKIIRDRAHAPLLTAPVTIEDILDERARELYMEEPRKTELTRIAFIMAQLRLNGYSLENFHQKNYYYDRVMKKNNFYQNKFSYGVATCLMEPYHVLWPIPDASIRSNTQAVINQNRGYAGAELNIPALDTPVE